MSSTNGYRMVTDSRDLKEVVDQAFALGSVALDTEFVWTDTYYPNLGLIQIGLSENSVALVDTLSDADLTILGPLIASPDVTKIFHDPEMDLPILYRACGTQPAAIFDTRLAAGFTGSPATLSLARLIEDVVGISLSKTEARTDWLRRPLSDSQLDYAVEDVRHMGALRSHFENRLDDLSNGDWFREESAIYELPRAYADPEPREQYRRVKGMGRLGNRELAVLREVTAVREELARELNRPRGRVLSDEGLMDIAVRKPRHGGDLRKIRTVYRKTAAGFGERIAAAVETGLRLPDAELPSVPGCPVPSKVLKKDTDRVLHFVRERSGPRGIDPILVAARKDATSLVLAAYRGKWESHRLLDGWRGALLQDGLRPILEETFARIDNQPELPLEGADSHDS